ncbi:hypothetical protein PR202_gb04411 [Eleusine coracana subsp. coracana]|uniref:Uncharacterized protein n=1 Tax=Eleusine coracana subsp. coracana TaxID=191504 RepID=A0AAV5E4M7_ELECO|nr:hypothetical protein PR202_gb04411 [Eleusine coracana subsp. coracana]
MEATRATPRPSCARRVLARKRPRLDDAPANSARKLQRREVAAGSGRAFSSRFTRERFRNIQLQEEFDTHDSTEKSSFELPSLRDRSGVCEILGASDIIFALSASGICTALSRVTKRRICILNVDPDQVICSMFYNKANDSIITVSAFASEDFKILSCRTTPIEFVRQAKPDAGFGLFETEILNEQSFLEVDDVNGKILIYSDPDRKEAYIPLEVLSIEDGKSLRSLKHLLHRSKQIEFIEQFDEKLFIKQKGENLQILDIRDCILAEVSRTEFVKPTSVIFLQRLHLFLTFHGRSMADSDDPSSYACSININDISTGKSLAKIRAGDLCKQKRTLEFQYTPSEALMDVTALYYDDAHEEIYTVCTRQSPGAGGRKTLTPGADRPQSSDRRVGASRQRSVEMEARRVLTARRLSSARRVLARKRQRPSASANSARKLQQREIAAGPGNSFAASFTRERFCSIRLQEEYDTNFSNVSGFLPPNLRNYSEIIEIVGAHNIIFALAQSGICSAFSRDEVIRSLFYNKNNDSLITVSVYGSEDYSALRCKTTPIEYIRRAQPDAGFPLFETESLELPGFVEFDDVNDKVLTYSAQNSQYKVFDLKNYTLLFTICDENVQEINICPGMMLLQYSRAGSYIPLEILSIEDGKRLMSFKHLLHDNKKIDFIEQFNEKLLIKQEGENLQILDLRDFKVTEVSRAEFVSPPAFIFLYERQLFLTFNFRSVLVRNFRGELVTSFEDHLLWNPDCNANNTYITSNQDLIISYCRDESMSDNNAFSINISEILTGKCLAKIKGGDLCKQEKASMFQTSPSEAMKDITALYYDEERDEIYTGNGQGLVHVWSS